MAFIRTNLQAGLISRQLEQVNRNFTTNLERLSTGLKLNRPDDNPGFYGMNVAQTLKVRSIDQGVINAQNAAGMMQTAEEGVTQIIDILNRAHDLAVTAADSTVDADARAQANTELKALLTGPDDGSDTELKQILDSVKYNNTLLLSESNSAASITTNSLENSSLTAALSAASNKLTTNASTFTDAGNIGTGGNTVNAATINLDTDTMANVDVGDALYIEAYNADDETTYTSQVLVVRETAANDTFVVVRLDGDLGSDVDEISNINTVMAKATTGDNYVKIYELPTTQLGDTRGANVMTDASFDFSDSANAQDVYTDLRIGVQLNSTQSGATAADPTLQSVLLTLSDTNPIELASSIQSQIETQLGGQYKSGGNKHIDVTAVAKTYIIVDDTSKGVDFTDPTGGGKTTLKALGWQPLTSDILDNSRNLVNAATPYNLTSAGLAEGDVVADIENTGSATSATGVKFLFTTTKTMNQDYVPRLAVNDDTLTGYESQSVSLMAAYKTDNGTKGNDQFDINVNGVNFRSDMDVVGTDLRATDSTSGNEAPKSIETILYEVWDKTTKTTGNNATQYGYTNDTYDDVENTHKATYAGMALKNVFQDGINDNRPSILQNEVVNVSYPVTTGKLTISSSTLGQASAVAIGSSLWDTTQYSGLDSVKDALGLVADRSDTGTGSDFTFKLGGNGDSFSITFDTFGATGLGEDNVDVSNLDISTQAGAEQAITTLENAVNSVSSSQTKIGAAINHMTRRMNVLETHSENLQGQQARFAEIDFTKETRQLASLQILLQSGTAALAQANIIPQTLLQLLA